MAGTHYLECRGVLECRGRLAVFCHLPNDSPQFGFWIMSTSAQATLPQSLSATDKSSPRHDTLDVYNLLVLVRQYKEGGTSARAANLPISEVQASTVREALATLVASARQLISECLAEDTVVPWISPPVEADEADSRFMVPLHL